MLHLRVESRETSRLASSINDETSMINPFDEELISTTSRESLCLGSPENKPSQESVPSVTQSRTWSESQWGNARMKDIMSG